MDNIPSQSQESTLYQNQPVAVSTPPPTIPPAQIPEEGNGSGMKKLFILVGGIVALLVIALLAFFIWTKLSSSNNQKVTLVYWGLWEDPSVFQGVIQDYERQHPNITIVYKEEDIKNLGDYVDRLRTRINNGNTSDTPDIFRYHNSWLVQLVQSPSVVLPFSSDFVKNTQLDSKYYPVVKKDLNIKGAYYGIPLELDTLAMFTNDSLFSAAGLTPPATWDDAASEAVALTVKTGSDQTAQIKTSGIGLGGFDNITHASDIISALLLQNHSDLNDVAGSTRQSAIDGLNFYTYFSTCHTDCSNKIWDSQGDESRLAFAKGNLAMYFGYSWDIPVLMAMNPQLTFSTHPLPHVAGQDPMTFASYWVEGISAKTKHPKEAEAFLEYLSSPDVLTKLYSQETKERRFGELYPRTDMASLLKDSEVSPFLDQARSASSSLFSSDTYDDALDKALDQTMGNAVRSILNGGNADSAVDQWAQDEKQNLQNYGL